MTKPQITAYLKPHCGWSAGVRAVLKKYELPFDERDVFNDPKQRMEMIQKSGQEFQPCVEINGKMLADVSGEEVEKFLVSSNLVAPSSAVPEVPIDQACATHDEPSVPIALRKSGTV